MTSVRRGTTNDVAQVVTIHQQAFDGFFMTSLGQRFLDRFYRTAILDPECVCYVAEREGELQGFVVGPMKPQGFFRRLLRRDGLRFLLDALPALLRRPAFVGRRLARAMRYRGEAPLQQRHAALISSIAVSPQAAGTGIAADLLNAFCDAAGKRGAEHVYLTTDRDNNVVANRFYAKHDFVLEAELSRQDGRVMNRLVRHLRITGTGDVQATGRQGIAEG